MATLLCLGFGYCARHYVVEFGARFDRIVGTTRSAEGPAHQSGGGEAVRSVEMLVFDGMAASREVISAIADADVVLVSAAPTQDGDPVLAVLSDALGRAPRLSVIVYLSTVGVYGNHEGAWVDENTSAQPNLERGGGRLEAEMAWQAFGEKRGLPVAVLRLAGIYGPGQNALVNLKRGIARRIAKPGQVFNRIHVADIAVAIDAAVGRRANGIFNVADDEPSPPGDPIVFAAALLGLAPPPEIPFADAALTMTPMALSFYGESKRVRNDKLKSALGVRLRYPTYREGLRALYAELASSAADR